MAASKFIEVFLLLGLATTFASASLIFFRSGWKSMPKLCCAFILLFISYTVQASLLFIEKTDEIRTVVAPITVYSGLSAIVCVVVFNYILFFKKIDSKENSASGRMNEEGVRNEKDAEEGSSTSDIPGIYSPEPSWSRKSIHRSIRLASEKSAMSSRSRRSTESGTGTSGSTRKRSRRTDRSEGRNGNEYAVRYDEIGRPRKSLSESALNREYETKIAPGDGFSESSETSQRRKKSLSKRLWDLFSHRDEKTNGWLAQQPNQDYEKVSRTGRTERSWPECSLSAENGKRIMQGGAVAEKGRKQDESNPRNRKILKESVKEPFSRQGRDKQAQHYNGRFEESVKTARSGEFSP